MQKTVLFNAQGIWLFGNPDLSDQDNYIILMLFTHLLRVCDDFGYRCMSVFLPPYTVSYCFTYFLFLKFCVRCRVPTDKESFSLAFLCFFLLPPVFFWPDLYGCCCSFPLRNKVYHPF